jgi:hypothetical protein
MKVALKYCGGCDPAFDRVEYFERIAKAAGGRITWTSLEGRDYQMVLVMCGCATACPQEELPLPPQAIVLKDDQMAPAKVVAQLLHKE